MNMKLTWFDDKETYHFFRDCDVEIPSVSTSVGHVRPYNLTPEISRLEERRKKVRSLANLYGSEYSQRLLYFHLSLDRFLRLKMPINRLSLLLNELYLFFERYLYMQLEWEKGEAGFYRDHSLHAANEAYLGYKLLNEIRQLEKKFIDYFNRNTEITRYLDDYCRIGHSTERIRHVVYRTWFIASLFHDVGYVMSFNKNSRDYMLQFHRHSDLINRASRSSFDDIQLLLGNSLLFNNVRHKDIEDSYNKNNHGVLSAFLLLATFYSPPAFDKVDPLDRAAIELAAEAIYHHDTPKDGKIVLTNSKKRNSPRPVFSGQWTECFQEASLLMKEEGEIKRRCIEKKLIPSNIYKIDFSKIKPVQGECNESRRTCFEDSPFAYYLRLIDELHVFGRNSLSVNTRETKRKESQFSFSMPSVRNIVKYPAQMIEISDNKLIVYFIADASLYSKSTLDKKRNFFYDDGHCRLDEDGIGFFLKELYWMDNTVKKFGVFERLDFYFIEGWPDRQIE